MRKVTVFNLVTVDGYFSGKGGDISWHKVDEEFQELAHAFWKPAFRYPSTFSGHGLVQSSPTLSSLDIVRGIGYRLQPEQVSSR